MMYKVMKYKIGDRVKIKSRDWYKENKRKRGRIYFDNASFIPEMSRYCGTKLTIAEVKHNFYFVEENNYAWTEEVIEGLVEEETKNNNDMEEKETLLGWVKESDSLRLVPHKDYEIKHDGDNFYLVKKKKEYPKTYCECKDILGLWDIDDTERGYYKTDLIDKLQMLLICRDAYWKIAGEEMGLGKPWEPNWEDNTPKFSIRVVENVLSNITQTSVSYVLTFPTEKMRDTFYENFKEEINDCKELL